MSRLGIDNFCEGITRKLLESATGLPTQWGTPDTISSQHWQNVANQKFHDMQAMRGTECKRPRDDRTTFFLIAQSPATGGESRAPNQKFSDMSATRGTERKKPRDDRTTFFLIAQSPEIGRESRKPRTL